MCRRTELFSCFHLWRPRARRGATAEAVAASKSPAYSSAAHRKEKVLTRKRRRASAQWFSADGLSKRHARRREGGERSRSRRHTPRRRRDGGFNLKHPTPHMFQRASRPRMSERVRVNRGSGWL